MLAELILYATAKSSRPLRRLGLVGDAVALWSRATRRRRDWADHERRCHAVVTEAVKGLASRRKVLVLGSGLLRDVPLPLLRGRFERVVLLDAVHLLPARFAARRRDVIAVVGDLTGMADMMAGASGPRRDPLAPWRDDPDLDLVISANVLSQLAMAPAARLERRPGRGDLPPDLSSDLAARIVGWHLDDLSRLRCPVCLLTDVSYRERRRDGSEGPAIDLLHGHDLARPDVSWDWEVAPRGEVTRDVAHVHRVHAWHGWREET